MKISALRRWVSWLLAAAVASCLLATLVIKHQQQQQQHRKQQSHNGPKYQLDWPHHSQEAGRESNSRQAASSSGSSSSGESINLFRPKITLTNEMIDQLSSAAGSVQIGGSELLREALASDSSQLLDLKNVTFPVEPKRQWWRRQQRARPRRRRICGRISQADQSEPINAAEQEEASEDEGQVLLIVVNSKWSNHERRKRIRSSWLNGPNLNRILCERRARDSKANGGGAATATAEAAAATKPISAISRIEYVFALGRPPPPPPEIENLNASSSRGGGGGGERRSSSNKLGERISRESKRFGDLLVINLYENYRSMSLKHLSIFKWLIRITSSSSAAAAAAPFEPSRLLVLKCDDDAQVDLKQLIDLYEASASAHSIRSQPPPPPPPSISIGSGGDSAAGRIHASDEPSVSLPEKRHGRRHWIMCARFPENSRVLRGESGAKWLLTRDEYQFDTFPGYCSGLAYLAPLELLGRLYSLAHALLLTSEPPPAGRFERPLWVDDVFVTGVLLESMANRPQIIETNAHFCYTRAQQSARAAAHSPCMISELV